MSSGIAKLFIGVVIGASLVWAGHAFGLLPTDRFSSNFSYTVMPLSRDQLGCKAVASTHLYAMPLGTSDFAGTVKIIAGRGNDTLVARIDGPRNQLKLITGADMLGGRTDIESIPIIRNDERTVLAAYTTDAAIYIFRLDKTTGNALWGKLGGPSGSASAWTHYMECR